jgi:hypothetical protein
MIRRAWPAWVLLLEVLVFFRQVLFTTKWALPYDLPVYHLPLAFYFTRGLSEWRFPLWDPNTYCGFPFYANIQAQAFYPPNWIMALIANALGRYKLNNILEWQVAIHVWIGGIFAYLLVRRLGMSRGAALFAATIFQLGGFFASQIQHVGAICGAAWLPLAWLGVVELSQKLSWRWASITSIALALSLLAGFPAIAVVVWGTFALAALLAVATKPSSWRLLPSAAAIVGFALLLCAPQLLPTRELINLGMTAARGDVDGINGVPWQGFVSLVIPNYFHVFEPEQFTLPYSFTFLYIYCGLAGLVLAIAAVFTRQRIWLSLFFAGCTLWMAGDHTPVYHYAKWLLPSAVRGASYVEFFSAAFVLSLGMLAAAGFDRWISPRGKVVAALVIVLTAADLTYQSAGRAFNTGEAAAGKVNEEMFDFSRKVVAELRTLTSQQYPPARIEMAGDSVTWPYVLPTLEIPGAMGNDPLILKRYWSVRNLYASAQPWERGNEPDKPESPAFDLVGARYLVTFTNTTSTIPMHPKFRHVVTADNHDIHENPRALPRFYLVPATKEAKSEADAVALLSAPDFNPATTGIVEGTKSETYGSGEVGVTSYKPEHIKARVEGTSKMFLASSEVNYPGWHAYIDGVETPIIQTNVAFKGVEVPAGSHVVEYRFTPSILWQGLGIGAVAWLTALVALRRRIY